MEAAQDGDRAKALKLLAQGAETNWEDYELARTPLMWAVTHGDVRLVSALLRHGADIKARDKFGSNALQLTVDGFNSYDPALPESHLNMVKLLLQSGIDVNARDGYGGTALMGRATAGDIRVMRLLLSHGANANVAYKDGRSALMLAAANGHADAVKILLDAGADVRAKDKTKKTALDWLSEQIVIEIWESGGSLPEKQFLEKQFLEDHVKHISEGRAKSKYSF